MCHCYFLNSFVKQWPILIVFGMRHQKNLVQATVVFATSLSLQYLVKCRICSLAIYNNEVILDSARVNSFKKQQTRLATTVSQKVTRVASQPLYYSMCSKCPPLARMRAANVDTTRKQQVQQPAFHKVV